MIVVQSPIPLNAPHLPLCPWPFSSTLCMRNVAGYYSAVSNPLICDIHAGPAEKEEIFYCIGSETQLVHHSKRGGERRDHRNEMENWEEAEVWSIYVGAHTRVRLSI